MTVNRLLIAAAGAGKTTYLVNQAFEIKNSRVLITTYTRSNAEEIRKKLRDKNKEETGSYCIPDNIIVEEWFTFLLKHGVRPYKAIMNNTLKYRNIGFFLSSEKSGKKPFLLNGNPIYYGEKDFEKYYFTSNYKIYSDKISKFIIECNKLAEGSVIDRILKIYPNIFIDEIQDLAGWDLDVIKLFLNSDINILMTGDPRQTTYLTNNASKYEKYKNGKIVEFIQNECKKSKTILDFKTLNKSHRNNNLIASLASNLYPNLPITEICSCVEHRSYKKDFEGIFIIKSEEVQTYMKSFPDGEIQVLKYENSMHPELNFGVSKGLSFDRVIIYPPKTMASWFLGKNLESGPSIAKLYVAITRARYSVAVVIDYKDSDNFIEGVQKFIQPN